MSHSSTTAAHLSKLTGLSVRQIQRLAKAGEIPGVRLSDDGYHREWSVTDETVKWITSVAKRRLKGRQRRDYEVKRQFSLPSKIRDVTGDIKRIMTAADSIEEKTRIQEWIQPYLIELWNAAGYKLRKKTD